MEGDVDNALCSSKPSELSQLHLLLWMGKQCHHSVINGHSRANRQLHNSRQVILT